MVAADFEIILQGVTGPSLMACVPFVRVSKPTIAGGTLSQVVVIAVIAVLVSALGCHLHIHLLVEVVQRSFLCGVDVGHPRGLKLL